MKKLISLLLLFSCVSEEDIDEMLEEQIQDAKEDIIEELIDNLPAPVINEEIDSIKFCTGHNNVSKCYIIYTSQEKED